MAKLIQSAPFISFEGLEGSGKSTQIARLARHLETVGHSVLVTREPGGTSLGESLRALLLAAQAEAMSVDAELLLMFAARAEHLAKRILPALRAGTWVLCDRFTDATYAYQGGGRGVPAVRIASLEDWVQGALRPDRVLFLDVPIQTGLQRARRRNVADRFEAETEAFFARVRAVYLERIAREPGRYRYIDGTGAVDEVAAAVRAAVGDLAE